MKGVAVWPGFADVLGHEQTIAHMKKAIELGKVSMPISQWRERFREETSGWDFCSDTSVSGKGNGAMYALSVMPSGAVHESAGYYQGDP